MVVLSYLVHYDTSLQSKRQLFYYKIQRTFITKCVSFFITKCAGFVIKCDSYYKMLRYIKNIIESKGSLDHAMKN